MTPPKSWLFFLVALLTSASISVNGQQRTIDSLTAKIETTPVATQRVDILTELSDQLYDRNSEQAYTYAKDAYELANESGYLKGIRRSLTYQGYYFFVKGKYNDALRYYRKSDKVALPEDDLLVYNNILKGNVFRTLAQYDSAQFFYEQALAILSRTHSETYLPFCYKSLGRLYVLQWKNDQAEAVFNKAIEVYERENNQEGLADTWFSLAEVLKNKSQFQSAARYVQKASDIARTSNDELLFLRSLILQGELKSRLGEFPEALKLYIQALGILKTKDLPLLVANLYGSIGDVYRILGENEMSLKFYDEALKIAERIGIKHEVAKIFGNIAIIYKNQNEFDSAYAYVDRSLAVRTEIKDDHGIAHCQNTLGTIYFRQKKFDEAITWLNRALEIRKRLKYDEGISSCLYNLSAVFASQNNLQKALTFQRDALQIEQSSGNLFNIGFSYNRIAELYLTLNQLDKAQASLVEAEKIAEQLKSRTLQMSTELNWSVLYERKGDQTKAYVHYKRYAVGRDKIYNDIGTQKLAELQALYMMERKDFEIEALRQERIINENEIQIQRSKIDLQNIIITSGIAGVALLCLLIITGFRYSRKITKANHEIIEQKEEIQAQSEELIDANQTIAEINKQLEGKIENRTAALRQAYKELDTFFYRSSHDFRRPLTTFMGLAEVAKVTVKDPNALELFDKVKETASNLDKMLVKLQSISDVGTQQLVYKEVMLKELFETVCDTFRDEIKRKNIKTSIEIHLKDRFLSYPAMIRIILENMIENALHFSGVDDPYIRLKAVQQTDFVQIEIEDNGQGIPQEYHEQIFDMYFRANERSKGNGLGLYIVKKAVEKLDGTISVSSVYKSGTTFTILLPITSRSSGPKY